MCRLTGTAVSYVDAGFHTLIFVYKFAYLHVTIIDHLFILACTVVRFI